MNRKRIDVLFLGNNASRTGAPIVLMRMLQWLRKHTRLSFGVVLTAGGPLESDFRELASTEVLYAEATSPVQRLLLRIPVLRRLVRSAQQRLLKSRVHAWKPRMIYANTCATGELLEFLRIANVPVATHVHELEVVIKLMFHDQFTAIRNRTDRYLAVSQAVRQNLISSYGVDGNDIETVPGFVDVADLSRLDRDDARRRFLDRFDLPDDAVIVGASGTPGWRKGSDVFVRVARDVFRKRPDAPIWFVWVGGSVRDENSEFPRHDCRRLGLDDRMQFIEAQTDPAPLYGAFDVFAMTSREDPYPLVILELGAMSVPAVCFDQAGGSQELIEGDAGFVVPYLDTDAMADRILELSESSALRSRLGERIRDKVAARNDTQVIMPRVLDVIERMMTPAPDAIGNEP